MPDSVINNGDNVATSLNNLVSTLTSQNPPAPAQQSASPVPAAAPVVTPPVDSWSDVRSKIGLSDDIELDTFLDHLVDLQDKADKVAAYEQQIAAAQAQQLAAQQQAAAPAPAAAPAEQAEEFSLPWKTSSVDPELRKFVVADPNGGYAPKNPANPVHVAAAQKANNDDHENSRFINDMLADPYGWFDKVSAKQMSALRKELKEQYGAKIEELMQKFQPVQETVARTQAEQQRYEWSMKNAATLFVDGKVDGDLTPVGSYVDHLLRSGKFTEDEALQFATSMAGALTPPPAPEVAPEAPAAPAKPIGRMTISKVAKANGHAAPSRFVDQTSRLTQAMIERPDSGEGSGKRNPSLADLSRDFNISRYGN